MTKKHFEFIAEEIKNAKFQSMVEQMKFVSNLADEFEKVNRNFDRMRFVKATVDQNDFMSNSQMRSVINQV